MEFKAVKTNVLWMGTLAGIITLAFGTPLAFGLATGAAATAFALVTGVGLGGLIALSGQLATDEPKNPLADIAKELVNKVPDANVNNRGS